LGKFLNPGLAAAQANPSEIPEAAYPFYLSTGRIIDHWHTLSMTGRIPELLRAIPYAFVEVNPKDAERLGIKPDDMVEIRSRRGVNVLPAKVYERPIVGMVFAYWRSSDLDPARRYRSRQGATKRLHPLGAVSEATFLHRLRPLYPCLPDHRP
jgi:anaerobic selenocysteine-containing dehydrogenase